jgi:site-specific DNA recombinase
VNGDGAMEKKDRPQVKNLKKKAVIYARYSSKNQQEQSIDIQVKACEELAARDGYEIVDKYCDYAKTGRNSNRAELQRLIADSAKGLFSTVFVHKMDRWFRNMRESLNCQKALKDNGVNLHSIEEGSSNTREGKVSTGIRSVLAEDESDRISDRIKGGQKETALKALPPGGTPPLGYDVDRVSNKYVINKDEATIVKKIFEMYVSGVGYKKILEYLNSMGFRTKRGRDFGSNSPHNILKNEKYVGRYIYGMREDTIENGKRRIVIRPREEWIIVENGIPAIIDEKLFKQAQVMLTKNKKAAGQYKAKEVYLLSGIARCGVCELPMHANTRPDGYSSYDCSSKNNRKKACGNKSVKREDLDNFVVDELYKNLFWETSAEELTALLNEYNENMSSEATEEIKLARREYRAVKEKIGNLLDFVADGGAKEKTVRGKMEDLEQKKRYARKHLREMKEQNEIETISEDMALDLLIKSKRLLKAHDKSNETERRNFIRSYVKKVIVYEDKIKVIFKIKKPDNQSNTQQRKSNRGKTTGG